MLNDKVRFYGKTKNIDLEEFRTVFANENFDYLDIVLLFGSRVIGDFHERSDYDLAVLVNDSHNDGWGPLSKVWSDIGISFGLNEIDYDVIDLQNLTDEMKDSIKNGYKIIKGDKSDISRILG